MKKLIIRIVTISILTSVLAIGSFVAVRISPYLYTKVYGNEETEILYSVYVLAKKNENMDSIMQLLKDNSLKYIDFPKDEIITINSVTDDHSETVVILYKNGKATTARFDDFL